MSKPSPRIIQSALRLRYDVDHLHQLGSSTPIRSPALKNLFTSTSSSSDNAFQSYPSAGFSNSATNLTSEIQSKLFTRSIVPTPTSSNGTCSRFLSSPNHKFQFTNIPISRSYNSASPSSKLNTFVQITPPAFSSTSLAFRRPIENCAGFRFFSFKSSDLGKVNGNFAKKIIDKPVSAITSTFSRYREAIGLQIEAFFKRNYLFLFGAGGVMVCALLWRIMFGIATTFVGLSEGMAKYGFLALSSAIVAFAGLYVRARFTINPDKVYRMAMRKLQTSAGILEVMGAPLSGSDLRAYVMSGGGLRLKNFKPTLRSKRCFLIFPLRGSERKGLVSVEVKKKNGQYDMKLLALDIPMASGPDQRLFLIGDEEEYRVGGGLVAELRDPVVKAMAATKEFDDLDKIEEEEEAERKRCEEVEKLEKEGR